jgi:hypothetical protein
VYTKVYQSETLLADIIHDAGDAEKPDAGSISYLFIGWTGYDPGGVLLSDITITASYWDTIEVPDPVDGISSADCTAVSSAYIWNNDVDKLKNEAAAGTLRTLVLKMKDGTISFDADSIRSLSDNVDTEVRFSKDSNIPDRVREAVGDRTVYDIRMGETHGFGGMLTVSVGYQPGEGEDLENLMVWRISADGSHESMPCTYSDGTVTFETNHLSYYAVMVETPEDDEEEFPTAIVVTIAIMAAAAAVIYILLRRRS